MTDISPIPTNDGDIVTTDWMADHATPRDRLRQAILDLEHEQNREHALLEARDRDRQQQAMARSRLTEASAAMQAFNKDQKARLAYAFLNGDSIETDRAAVQSEIADAQDDLNRLEAIEAAIDDEITKTREEIRALSRKRDERLAEFIVDADEYQQLIALHRHAWTRLRTIKEALRAVAAGCRGQLPAQFADEPNRSEPLEPRIGYGVEETFLEAWVETMQELAVNADSDLPLFG